MFRKAKRNVSSNSKVSKKNLGSTNLMTHMSVNEIFDEKDVIKLANKFLSEKADREVLAYLIAYVLEAYQQDERNFNNVLILAQEHDFQEITLCINDLKSDYPNSIAAHLFQQASHTKQIYEKSCIHIADKLKTYILWNKK